MFLTLLAVTFVVALLVTFIAASLFTKSAAAILDHEPLRMRASANVC